MNASMSAKVAAPAVPKTAKAMRLIDRDGRQIINNGKPQYAVVLKWRSRDIADRFSDAVVELVRQQHPDALNVGGAP
jgi:hypothetical protein